jgi:acyl carrier protein
VTARTPRPDPRVVAGIITLAGRCGGGERPDDPEAATPLVDGGFWLDSLALLELLVACEEAFNVRLDPDMLAPAHLRTIADLAAVIEAHLRGGASPV